MQRVMHTQTQAKQSSYNAQNVEVDFPSVQTREYLLSPLSRRVNGPLQQHSRANDKRVADITLMKCFSTVSNTLLTHIHFMMHSMSRMAPAYYKYTKNMILQLSWSEPEELISTSHAAFNKVYRYKLNEMNVSLVKPGANS